MIFGKPHLETWSEYEKRKGEWSPFFPLFPRHIEGVGYVWLQYIERRQKYAGSFTSATWRSEYRLKQGE